MIQSLPGWPSLASSHCCKLLISLLSMLKFAWPLSRRSPWWPSTSDPPNTITVSELFVLSLSLSGPISIPPVFSMWKLRSLTLPDYPASLWWVVILSVLYVVQYDWYLSPMFPSSFAWWINQYFCCSILSCAEHLYIHSMVGSLTRQEWWCACWHVVWPSSWSSYHEVPESFTW